jgi:hypothetical protein
VHLDQAHTGNPITFALPKVHRNHRYVVSPSSQMRGDQGLLHFGATYDSNASISCENRIGVGRHKANP